MNKSATDRKKPGVAFWATVVASTLLLYVAGFGPAAWLVDRGWIAARPVARVYRPVLIVLNDSPDVVWVAVHAYVGVGSEEYGCTTTRLLDAAGLIRQKEGLGWPADPRHEIPHRSIDHSPFRPIRI